MGRKMEKRQKDNTVMKKLYSIILIFTLMSSEVAIASVYKWTNSTDARIVAFCKVNDKSSKAQYLAEYFISLMAKGNERDVDLFTSNNRECYWSSLPVKTYYSSNLVLVKVIWNRSYWINSSCGTVGCVSQIIVKIEE